MSRPEAMELVKLGVSDFFLKDNPPELLARSVRQVMRGELWLDQQYVQAVAAHRPAVRSVGTRAQLVRAALEKYRDQ